MGRNLVRSSLFVPFLSLLFVVTLLVKLLCHLVQQKRKARK